ncbi:hypothetical protein Hanom_Chr09g00822201 [Helianthus anomalus]
MTRCAKLHRIPRTIPPFDIYQSWFHNRLQAYDSFPSQGFYLPYNLPTSFLQQAIYRGLVN